MSKVNIKKVNKSDTKKVNIEYTNNLQVYVNQIEKKQTNFRHSQSKYRES